MTAKEPHTASKVGDRITDFSVADVESRSNSLGELSGQAGVVIGFLHGTYCPHCLQQLNRSNRLADQLDEHQVKLVWFLRDEPHNIAAYQLAANPVPRFAILPDSSPSVGEHFGIPDKLQSLQPTAKVYYVDGERTIRHIDERQNPHAPPDMQAIIEAIRSQK